MTIAILGAGEIGAAAARQLAAADVVRQIILIDDAASVAIGKALDITQAGAVDRYDTRVTGSGDSSAAIAASVVVLTDPVDGSEDWHGAAALALLGRLALLNARAPIVCAGPRADVLIDRGVHELRLPPTRLMGTAPEALRGAAVAMVALECGRPPADISLLVVGRAPADLIIPWDLASIAGQRATDVLSPPAITRIEQRMARLWPPAPHALASAVTLVVRSMIQRGHRTHVLQVSVARGDAGPGRSAMLPAQVNAAGVARVFSPVLPSRDRVRLETVLAS